MPPAGHFHMLSHVIACLRQFARILSSKTGLKSECTARAPNRSKETRSRCSRSELLDAVERSRFLPQAGAGKRYSLTAAAGLLLTTGLISQAAVADASQRAEFAKAWQAASRGDRAVFEQIKPGLADYLLYPYLQYEDFRHRRAAVPEAEMANFLAGHDDWAFTAGLKTAWLRTLGARRQWEALVRQAGDSKDTRVQCHLARARIELGQTDGLVPVAQTLWAVGQSQPDDCDPVFNWLRKQGGIDSGLAWERIRRAMEARQPRLTLYLKRYLDADQQVWADRWYQQDRTGYRQLQQAARWADGPKSRDITRYGISRLARNDADRAWRVFHDLDARIDWAEDERIGLLREMALWSAVEGADETHERMLAVPAEERDGRLLEWWVRFHLARENWNAVLPVIEQMNGDQRDDSRWRYWEARALQETGDLDAARNKFGDLALRANYHGFLAADRLDLPYAICEQSPDVKPSEVKSFRAASGFERALELREAGIQNWSRAEWQLATRGLDRQGLRVAAALAHEENWPDRVISALGNSGDLRWYEWRFPVTYGPAVNQAAGPLQLDASWVMGLMRSESAMAEDAISSAGARGLMQVMPDTARALSRRHGIPYGGKDDLVQAEVNIRFGTTYLRELSDRFGENPVLVSGAYNAGPHSVDRWMDRRQSDDPVIWVETLPYYETRDYIPRVLAFTTLYDWRLQQPVQRLSSRMPSLAPSGQGAMISGETVEVVCPSTATTAGS